MSVEADWPHIFHFPVTEKWKVKLCRLWNDAWNIYGEGFIYGQYHVETDEFRIIVNSDDEDSSTLFSSIIKAPVQVQKQDSILLWSGAESDLFAHEEEEENIEPATSEDGLAKIAIGFQLAGGCASISEFILYAISQTADDVSASFSVQLLAANDGSGEGSVHFVDGPISLPPLPTELNLTIVLNSMNELLSSSLGREFLIVYLDYKAYLERIWAVFCKITGVVPTHQEEQQLPSGSAAGSAAGKEPQLQNHSAKVSPFEKIQMLWTISDIIKLYFMLGDSYLVEEIVHSDQFIKVLSMLEYDRAFGVRKANFKTYYKEFTAMKQVFESEDFPAIERIHQTFRLQLLRDILVRSADDFTFQIFRTLICVNHSEILEYFQNSPELCRRLFSIFDSSSLAEEHQLATQNNEARMDAISFLYDVMKTSKTFAYSQLKPLYTVLLETGLIDALSYGFELEREYRIRMMALESLNTILELDVALIVPYSAQIISLIMRSFVERSQTASANSFSPTTRAINIEVAEILKRILSELPKEAMQTFFNGLFEALENLLDESIGAASLELNLLDILTHCFASHPDITGTLMKDYGVWDQISKIQARITTLRCSNSHANSKHELAVEPQRGYLEVQRSMAIIRLVREAIQPAVITSTLQCAEQAKCLITSGLFPNMIKHHVRCSVSRALSNDAEQSSFVNLLHVIVNGRRNTDAEQFEILVNWMTSDGIADIRALSHKYGVAKCLLTAFTDNVKTDPAYRRNPLINLKDWRYKVDHSVLSLSTPSRNIVDEVDDEVLVLAPGSFPNGKSLQITEHRGDRVISTDSGDSGKSGMFTAKISQLSRESMDCNAPDHAPSTTEHGLSGQLTSYGSPQNGTGSCAQSNATSIVCHDVRQETVAGRKY